MHIRNGNKLIEYDMKNCWKIINSVYYNFHKLIMRFVYLNNLNFN